jgi:hypothetical protein
MSDDTTDDTAADTTGHVLHGDAAEHPVTGGQAPGIARALATGEDDTEGHLARAATDEPEDDTEGHRVVH